MFRLGLFLQTYHSLKPCQSSMFVCVWICLYVQLNQALAGKFNAHVHVEYEWCLQHEDLDESDEDLDEKVRDTFVRANNNTVFMKMS